MAILIRIAHGLPRGSRDGRHKRTLRRLLGALLPIAVLCVVGTLWAPAAEPQLSEPQIKAAFLVNFPKYVDWPAEVFAKTNSPIVLSVLGGNKLGDELAKMVAGKTVEGHPLMLKIVAKDEEIPTDCHILFVGATERQRFPAILKKLGDAPILTVGESDDFLANGGIINLGKQDKKVSVEVNLGSANKARLRISSKLLNVAHVQKDTAR